jgi:hypothetical protein
LISIDFNPSRRLICSLGELVQRGYDADEAEALGAMASAYVCVCIEARETNEMTKRIFYSSEYARRALLKRKALA